MTDRVRAIDYHTGGEPFRIVPEPPVGLPGRTVAERCDFAIGDPAADRLRRLLCHEPRGRPGMYGGLLVPPDDDGARLGVVFFGSGGFATACGHGTIALGAWVVRAGLVGTPADGVTDVPIDVPSGRVTARVHTTGGRVTAVGFVSVASYVVAEAVALTTSRGPVSAALSYGGALYAQVDAGAVGLEVAPRHLPALVALGREVRTALTGHPAARHPGGDRLGGIHGTIFHENVAGPTHQRNVTIFADGQVDRSPCGSGTAARVATLAAIGRLAPGQEFVHDSMAGSRFVARYAARPEVIPVITGMAYPTGEHTFVVDPDDPLTPGFLLR
ncbi:proline racemase family protein [Actinoplanes sp. DH11]|uniref:proline racemase family protein n=1 Tax=Actinoplanes sp. DH11 TaxID=2857011 RepID=UPI001E5D8941|nr:proline racemase family protein [Actinoplanes sp. DH11]